MRQRILAIIMLAGLTLVAAPAPAPAPVPPKDCGIVQAKGKRFNVKADQLRCKRARRYARRYLRGNGKPDGYKCKDYGPETAIEFRCSKGGRVLFAIRR